MPEGREDSLQNAISATLKLTFPDLYFHHSPNGWYSPGGKPWQNARQGAKLKAMGTKAGFPDFLFLIPEIAFIELKVPGNYLEPDQRKFRDMCQAMNIKWALCRSYEEVRDTLIQWGVACRETVKGL